jgi:heme/copper-type cytochrome/quinol oxidase subunit 2
MKIEMAAREQSSSENEERANNIAYAGLVVAVFGTISGIVLTIYFKCQKSETKEENPPGNPET